MLPRRRTDTGTTHLNVLRLIGLVALALLALIGNYFKLPLFLNVDLIFGSIAAVVALRY
jgi:hypothetical protein